MTYMDFEPESLTDEYVLLVGRLEAFAGYVAQSEYSIDREVCAAMLGFKLPEKTKTEEEHEKNWFDVDGDRG